MGCLFRPFRVLVRSTDKSVIIFSGVTMDKFQAKGGVRDGIRLVGGVGCHLPAPSAIFTRHCVHSRSSCRHWKCLHAGMFISSQTLSCCMLTLLDQQLKSLSVPIPIIVKLRHRQCNLTLSKYVTGYSDKYGRAVGELQLEWLRICIRFPKLSG